MPRARLTTDVHVRLPKIPAATLRRAAADAGIPFSTYCRLKLVEAARSLPEPRRKP